MNFIHKESKPCSYWTEWCKENVHCIHHMSDEEWGEVIETAMDKSHKKVRDKMIQKTVKEVFELEWDHAMEKYDYKPDGQKGSTFSRLGERTTNKAFTTVFKDKYISIYNETYDDAMDKYMISDNSSLVWELEDNKQIDLNFDRILNEELEASKAIVYEEIKDMVEEEFKLAVRKKWFIFKTDINEKMLLCNKRRKQWALQKLEEIKHTFKESWSSKDMDEFLEDNQSQIEDIFCQYETEIQTVDQNSVKRPYMQYYCFTDYIKTFPNLDFMDKAHSQRSGSTEQLIDDDKYGYLIESLWLQLDVEREKCSCHACTTEYCKADCTDAKCTMHNVTWHKIYWTKECEKIIRQRLKKRSYRTCRFCLKDIPKDDFEKVKCSYEQTFTRLHMDPCAKKHGFYNCI